MRQRTPGALSEVWGGESGYVEILRRLRRYIGRYYFFPCISITAVSIHDFRHSRDAGVVRCSTNIDGERKTVTALFADIKGSMELMEDLDPEEARAIVDPALKLMIDATHRYDGYIVQSTGDGIFALFGAPVAHEDHPQRALYAALRM
jgi:class 3 adenylate cyclase